MAKNIHHKLDEFGSFPWNRINLSRCVDFRPSEINPSNAGCREFMLELHGDDTPTLSLWDNNHVCWDVWEIPAQLVDLFQAYREFGAESSRRLMRRAMGVSDD